MRYKIFQLSLVTLVLILITSCKTIFTGEMKIKLESNNIDLSKIQYYNSSKITLTRTLLDSESDVENGRIKLENGKRIQVIVLKKNTPGALSEAGDSFMDLHFEKGENRDLQFKFIPERDNFQFAEESVLYEGNWFKVSHGSIPKIKVKKKDLSKTIKELRRIKGVKVAG